MTNLINAKGGKSHEIRSIDGCLGRYVPDAACKFLSEQGVQMVEIGCGGFPGTAHCNAAELLADENKQKEFLDTIHKYGLEISALSAHGKAVHPE